MAPDLCTWINTRLLSSFTFYITYSYRWNVIIHLCTSLNPHIYSLRPSHVCNNEDHMLAQYAYVWARSNKVNTSMTKTNISGPHTWSNKNKHACKFKFSLSWVPNGEWLFKHLSSSGTFLDVSLDGWGLISPMPLLRFCVSSVTKKNREHSSWVVTFRYRINNWV